jgi:hypothetical protein
MEKLIVQNVKVENIVIQVVVTYVLHVQLARNQTQQTVVVYHVEVGNIVTQKVGMYVQHVLLDMN